MSLPQHLENYEFQRKLVLSTDVDRFYHLKVERKPDGTPICTASGKAEFTPMNVKEILGQVGPLEIEIGCGKGNFLADYCTQNPNTSFIGIDHEPSIAHIAAKRVLKLRKQGIELKHARVIYGDAFYLFRDFMEDKSVSAFHMYFPDPWPKKRHRKRRLFHQKFLNQVRRVAIENALFHWGTDYQNYHEETLELLGSQPWVTIENPNAPPTDGIMTNFEKKYRKEGRPIYRCVFRIRS